LRISDINYLAQNKTIEYIKQWDVNNMEDTMTNGQLAQRVDSLEDYMKVSYQALKTERELARLSLEMPEFKDEMHDFKDEMREFKEEARQDWKESNRRWGELANKMGTLVKDIVAPSLPRVAKEFFDCDEPEMFAVRMRRK
jgi:predicted RNase H-like nuclease (RuvC/YqgF family)